MGTVLNQQRDNETLYTKLIIGQTATHIYISNATFEIMLVSS